MPAIRHRRLWLTFGFAFLLAVAFLSLTRDPPPTHRLLGVKLGHFSAYAWLMFWFAQLFRRPWTRLLIAALLCAFGVGIEYVQSFTDYRTFSYWDMRDNALGLAAGLLLSLTPLRCMLAAVENALARCGVGRAARN